LCRHAHRPDELRRVRNGMRGGPGLLERHLRNDRLHDGTHRLHWRVRGRSVQPRSLRWLRNGVSRRSIVFGRNVRVCARCERVWRRLRESRCRPGELRCLWKRVCGRLGLFGGGVQHDGVHDGSHELHGRLRRLELRRDELWGLRRFVRRRAGLYRRELSVRAGTERVQR
jgi:hypothetical protein